MYLLEERKVKVKKWIDYMRLFKPDITKEQAEFILWEETSYPFYNPVKSVKQEIREYFKRKR
jgi:apolipoprotein N-acyltransferase